MNYYKPTSLLQRVEKLLQLHWLYCKARFARTSRMPAARTMSILMVVPQADRVGGYERQAWQLASAATKQGCLVELLTERAGALPSRELRTGLAVYRIPSRLRPRPAVISLASVMFLLQQRKRVHVLHAHGVTGFSLLAVRVAGFLGKPVLLKPATHGDLHDLFGGTGFKRRIYRSWIRRVDRLVAISNEMKEEMLGCGIPEGRIRRIPNFVDTARYVCTSPERKAALRVRYGVHGDEFVFLFLGRLEERKGVHHLLRAWQDVRSGLLWIVGTGPEEQRLKTISRDLSLRNVVFHGATGAPLDFYQCADLLVFPSLREGSPNVLLEAMSCGLPCVATAIGGVMDLMQHDAEGYLVPPGSPEALAKAMEYAASHPADRKRWGEAAARIVRERFDISQVLAQYTDLYSELMKGC